MAARDFTIGDRVRVRVRPDQVRAGVFVQLDGELDGWCWVQLLGELGPRPVPLDEVEAQG